MRYIYTYFAIALLLLSWIFRFAYIGLDKHDRRFIKWGRTLALVVLSALFWPVILFRNPKIIRQPTEFFKQDTYSAMIERERDKVRRELKQCSNRVRFETSDEGNHIGEFEFPSEAIAGYLSQRTAKDGYGFLSDQPDIQAWVKDADRTNSHASEVPWVWGSFKLLATELIESGIGNCFCGTCRAQYENQALKCETGNGSPGWIAIIIKCPLGHEVMKFDLMKPFCSHTRNSGLESDQATPAEQRVPVFLKKVK